MFAGTYDWLNTEGGGAMKVVYHQDFNQSYCADPAAAEGRIEAVYDAVRKNGAFIEAVPAAIEDIAACHTQYHIDHIKRLGHRGISGGWCNSGGNHRPGRTLLRLDQTAGTPRLCK